MDDFQYNAAFRKLDAALDEDLKVAAPAVLEPCAVEEPGLLRLSRTSIMDSLESSKLAAAAGAERELLEQQVALRLQDLENEKSATVDRFIEAATALRKE